MARFRNIAERLADLRRRNMYRRRRVLDSPQGREIIAEGRRLLNFCSNDYLGLAADDRVRDAFRQAIGQWGVGAGASHLVCGHTRAHHELEQALAEFTGRPRALLFSSGYAANMGTVAALVGAGDIVLEDRLNHASLLDGGWISRAEFAWYRHAETADLAAQLAARQGAGGHRLIVSDGTFSMDGDLCPLDDIVRLAREHGAWIMIDDAHGMGVHGRAGGGLVDPMRYGLEDVPVLMGTLGKAFGTAGAFVAGSEDLVELLIQRARTYIYTTALPAAVATATLASLAIARAEEWRRQRLRELIMRFRRGASELGLRLMDSETPIQPVLVGDPGVAVQMSQALEERGMLVTAIRPPTVPVGTSRLRVTLTAAHDDADVDRLLEAFDATRSIAAGSGKLQR
jgi:8-amino-7-oxononanoate synthase